MIDLNKLKNVEPFVVNTSRIGNGTEVPEKILEYNKNTLGSVWIDIVILILFLTSLYFFSKKEDPFSFGFIQSITISSILSFVVTAGLVLSGFSRNIYPLYLYGSISLVGFIFVYLRKKKRG